MIRMACRIYCAAFRAACLGMFPLTLLAGCPNPEPASTPRPAPTVSVGATCSAPGAIGARPGGLPAACGTDGRWRPA